MAGFSNYMRQQFLRWFRGTAVVAPPTVGGLWVSLHLVDDPGLTGASEVSPTGTGYGRENVACSSAAWNQSGDVGLDELIDNINAITFNTATAAWGVVKGVGIWDAETGGNFLFGGSTTNVDVQPGMVYKFEPGELDLRLR